MPYCSRCGEEIHKEDKFCRSCGNQNNKEDIDNPVIKQKKTTLPKILICIVLSLALIITSYPIYISYVKKQVEKSAVEVLDELKKPAEEGVGTLISMLSLKDTADKENISKLLAATKLSMVLGLFRIDSVKGVEIKNNTACVELNVSGDSKMCDLYKYAIFFKEDGKWKYSLKASISYNENND